jgi:CheY-like chemotaxis protein
VFLDLGMPNMNGFETARRLRADTAGQELAIIALTGYGGAGDVLRAHEAGFDDLAIKPIPLGQLKELIGRLAR